MQVEEYNKYFELMYSKESAQIINGDSGDEVSKLRNKICISFARVGQELARLKNKIDQEFQRLTESGMTATAAVRMSEVNINKKEPVSRREIQYLREALLNMSNSCASRLSTLAREGNN